MCLESYCSPKCRYEATGKRPKDNPCFITTAVCEQSGLPDHCFELTTLRAFRDRHMSTSEDNRKLLEQYYVIAPRIVEKIDQMANRNEIYALLREKFITPSVEAADQGNDMKAQEIYVAMMQWVEALVEVHQ
jgi:uncharacterized protein (DUF2336 family)